ncbi:MAG: tetratricopeptide repeat protein [Proteobacteria bacterium]|nr:tetratricopeptide repeat protein [Pseudomonadota bacterium]
MLNWEIPNPDTAPMQPRVAQLFGEARQAVVRRPDSAEAWGRFGAVYDAHGLYDGAIACYRKALALAPNDFRFIYNLGMVLEWSGDTSEEPLNLLQTAVRLEPDYPPVFVRLGDTLARAGRRREARDAYRRATELDPNFAIAHRSLGQVLLALDDVNTALAHLERAAQLMPNDGLVFAALAQSYLRLGQRQLADAAVEKSRRLPSNLALPDPIRYWVVSLGISSEICYERGKGLLRAGDYVGATGTLTFETVLSETLDPAVRESCMRVWNATLSDAYSSEELGMIAFQCPENTHYHLQAENLFVEILDEEGALCAPGQVGRVVVTDLHNFAMPLIRYEIGDYAEAGEPCPCGRGLPVITRILGRTRNMLTLPSGEQIWPAFAKALREALPQLRQAQLVQRTLDEIEVRLVVARPLTPREEDRARRALGKALSDAFAYRFVYVDEIPRSAAGKFEEVKSALGDRPT